MSYFQRKFHMELLLPDGNIWKGFINCEADIKEELHTIDEIKGTFFIEKLKEGWNSYFFLENTVCDRRKNASRSASDSIITTGVFRPDKHFKTPYTAESAEAILEYLKPINYKTLPRIYGLLQDCLTGATETYEW